MSETLESLDRVSSQFANDSNFEDGLFLKSQNNIKPCTPEPLFDFARTPLAICVEQICDPWVAHLGVKGHVGELGWYHSIATPEHAYLIVKVHDATADGVETEWWLRIERFKSTSLAIISTVQDRVMLPDHKQHARMSFRRGVTLEQLVRISKITCEQLSSNIILGSDSQFYTASLVKLLGAYYRYEHSAEETWIRGSLVDSDCRIIEQLNRPIFSKMEDAETRHWHAHHNHRTESSLASLGTYDIEIGRLQWFQDSCGGSKEYLILHIDDFNPTPSSNKTIYVRLQPSPGNELGAISRNLESLSHAHSERKAEVFFPGGLKYNHFLEELSLMGRTNVAFASLVDTSDASTLLERLALRLENNLARCKPQDLLQIFNARASTRWRLAEMQWQQTESEYMLLRVTDMYDFINNRGCWLRIERYSSEDRIIISRNERLALIRGSKPIARMTFPDGVPFLPSMDFIAGIPPPTTSSICDDTWFYTSNIAHRLTQHVGESVGECPAEDLCALWEGQKGSQLRISGLQWFREAVTAFKHEYIVLRLLKYSNSDSEQELWVRLERCRSEDRAAVAQNPRHLIYSNSSMIAEIIFPAVPNDINFGHTAKALKAIQQVCPRYPALMEDCWFYAATLAEMMIIQNSGHAIWNKGSRAKLCDQRMFKKASLRAYREIEEVIRQGMPGFRGRR